MKNNSFIIASAVVLVLITWVLINCDREYGAQALTTERTDIAATSYLAPRISCDSPKHDFGTEFSGTMITNEFILTNCGDSPLVISTIKYCCGVTSTLLPMHILPGSNAVCRAIFDTRNRYGRQEKQIRIVSNDPKQPYYILNMVGTLRRPVEFSPRLVRIGSMIPDGEIFEIITATNLLNEAVKLKSVTCTIKNIETFIMERTSDAVSDQRSWLIALKSTASVSVEKIKGKIQLNFSTGTVDVPVLGVVTKESTSAL